MQGQRYESRRRKKMNRFLNIAIGVVIVLIVGVGLQLFLSNNDDTASTTPQDQTDGDQSDDSNGGAAIADPATDDEESESNGTVEDDSSENSDSDTNARVEDEEDEVEDEDDADDADNEEDSQEEGEWEPVGTEQTGEFVPNFNEGSQNWNEMVTALESATGVSSGSMTLWRLENGGSPTAAVGTLSDQSDNSTTSQPYRVRIEWQEGQGWQPVSMEQLDSNPYR